MADVRFVCVIRVSVCPVCVPAPPGVFLPVPSGNYAPDSLYSEEGAFAGCTCDRAFGIARAYYVPTVFRDVPVPYLPFR